MFLSKLSIHGGETHVGHGGYSGNLTPSVGLLTTVTITIDVTSITFTTFTKELGFERLTWGNLYSPRSLAMETDRDDRVSPTKAA